MTPTPRTEPTPTLASPRGPSAAGAGAPIRTPIGPPGRTRRAAALALASIASFMVALDLLVVTTALDAIRRDVGASPASLQWVVTAYAVSFAALLMTGAALGDRFGRRRLFAIGLGAFVAASAAAALADTIGPLIAARVVQGAAAALIVPLGLTIVTAAFPSDRRGAAIGVLEGITGLAVIAGPLVGGLVVHHAAWEWVFWLNVPIGLIAIPLVLTVLDESHGPDRTLDGVGLLLVAGASFGVVWGLAQGNTVGWLSGQVVAALACGALFAAAFVGWERRTTAPMLPMRFFAQRAFSAGTATAFLLSASLYSSVFLMAPFLQAGLGHDSLAAGLRLVPWTAMLLVVAPPTGRLADRVGPRPLLIAGLALQAVGLAGLALVARPDLPYAVMLVPLVVAGIGCSMALPVSQAAVVGAVRDDEVGKAVGTNNTLQELGGAFGVAVSVAAFVAAGSYRSAGEVVDGYRAGIAAAACFALAGVATAFALPRR